MGRPRILYVLNNHPRTSPGGAEIYSYELYHAVRDGGGFDPTFVAKMGPPMSIDPGHEGTRFALAGDDPNDYLFYTEHFEFDRVTWTSYSKRLYIDDWRTFLKTVKPDLVHFQHVAFLGFDLIRETRRTLPDAPIIYMLHEFMPICHHNGQMVRRDTEELCYQASPRRCNECFPKVSPELFFLRERFIKSAFEFVDLFITPSAHARGRYIEWGIPPEKIRHVNHGRIPVAALPDPPDAGRRRRIGFIGQITRFKGVDLLLEAVKILQQRGVPVQLQLHGANLERTAPAFQESIRTLLEETSDSVRFPGRYEQRELPALMSAVDWVIVPSIWWETGPLVIHEALVHHRPVICSDIGSMVERIQDGVNGLHFRAGDPYDLADKIQIAVGSPELWDRLRSGIKQPQTMDEHATKITAIYDELLGRAERPVAA
jgi:glycosyltransferase involved in cell wall biosynthesis